MKYVLNYILSKFPEHKMSPMVESALLASIFYTPVNVHIVKSPIQIAMHYYCF